MPVCILARVFGRDHRRKVHSKVEPGGRDDLQSGQQDFHRHVNVAHLFRLLDPGAAAVFVRAAIGACP